VTSHCHNPSLNFITERRTHSPLPVTPAAAYPWTSAAASTQSSPSPPLLHAARAPPPPVSAHGADIGELRVRLLRRGCTLGRHPLWKRVIARPALRVRDLGRCVRVTRFEVCVREFNCSRARRPSLRFRELPMSIHLVANSFCCLTDKN
jgi:hypothetical protein